MRGTTLFLFVCVSTNFISKKKNREKRCANTEKKNIGRRSGSITAKHMEKSRSIEMEYKGANHTIFAAKIHQIQKYIAHLRAQNSRFATEQLRAGREYNASNEFYPVLNFVTIVAYRRILTA